MDSKVFVYTNSFPFGVGEQFIESEAPYWEGEWTVAPSDVSAGSARAVHVSIDRRFAVATSRRLSIKDLFFLFGNSDFWLELIRKPYLLVQYKRLRYLCIFLIMAERLIERLEEHRPERESSNFIVYTYWFSWACYAFAKYKQKTKSTFPLICRAHRVDLYRYGNPYNYMPLDKNYAEFVDQIFSISSDGAEYLSTTYGVDRAKISVSRLGTRPKSLLATRSEDEILRILSVSYMKPIKRLDKIVDAVAHLISRGVRVEWTHIGGGELDVKLKTYANDKKIKVNWLGQVSNSEVELFYENNSVDVFVNSSESEGIPVSIMEAISFGVPVVATDVGGTREIVSDIVGTLVPSGVSGELLGNKVFETWRRRIPREVIANYQNELYSVENYRSFVKGVKSFSDRDLVEA